MDQDPIQKLRRRVTNTKKQRDDLEAVVKKAKEELEVYKTRLSKLKEDLAVKNESSEKRQKKIQKIDKLKSESDRAISKIVGTSLSLEKAIDDELIAAKNSK